MKHHGKTEKRFWVTNACHVKQDDHISFPHLQVLFKHQYMYVTCELWIISV